MDGRDDSTKSPYKIIEELRAIIAEQAKTIARLENEISILKERLTERERQLGLNSRNSSKPPSSDGFKKPSRVQSLREKSGKKAGGQLGHTGSTLKQIENPDSIKQHKVTQCPCCNSDLSNVPVDSLIKRQIFDVPEIKPIVTEHQFEVKYCPGCNKKVESPKEQFINAPVQYGNNAKSIITYLNVQNLVPVDRVAATMRDIFGLGVSTATVENVTKLCSDIVAQPVAKIESILKSAAVKGSDESGLIINEKINWVHTLSNDKFVYYRLSEKRGDISTGLSGTVTHDHFVSYYSKLEGVQHSLCNAHHLRELKALIEIDKELWARSMFRLLLLGCTKRKQDPTNITDDWLTRFRRLYDKIISTGLAFHEMLEPLSKPKRGKIKRRPGHNLLLRLKNCADDTLRFLYDPNVPFTNNSAEQSLRMVKVKQKVSGCFRTFDGAKHFLNIRSYTATAQKNDFNVFDALTKTFCGNPFDFAPS